MDTFGRVHRKLRISVTDRCNMRCRYCMTPGAVSWMPKETLLSYEEIVRASRILTTLGVAKFRLTGGEPTLRKDIEKLVFMLSHLPSVHSVSMTTNGTRLSALAQDLKDAGLNGITVSLDTLNPLKFRKITHSDAFFDILKGLDAAENANLFPVKINCVVMRGINDDEILEFAMLSLQKPYSVRFIEFMPLDDLGLWKKENVVTQDEMMSRLQQKFHIDPLPHDSSSPSRRFSVEGKGEIGFISSVSRPFCDSCDRLRLTADGKIRNCLFSQLEYDLKPYLRENATDQEIQKFLQNMIQKKWKGHGIGQEDYKKPQRAMHAIGG